jgi:hypothetical protein
MGAARKLTPPAEDGLSMLIGAQVQAQAEIAVERAKTSAFLGVTQSAKGFAWRDRLETGQQKFATTISQRHGLPELLGRMLAARGVHVDTVPLFLDPTIKATWIAPRTDWRMPSSANSALPCSVIMTLMVRPHRA